MPADTNAEDLANRTIQRINNALEKRQIAGVPEVIHLIQELSTKAFSITVKELAEIISQDVAVTAKVISAANTVGYNPTGVPVNTVSQSIQVIGFERVRNLAISLLLVQNAEQSMTAQEQREAAAFALSSGLVAQSLMDRQGSLDPEQAFVCTSLRNYGRLLMTTFLIDEYREALERAQQLGEDRAFREVFGLTPLELSYHLLLSSHLPKEILRSLQTLPTTMVHSTVLRPEDELLIMADFAVRLCSLATNAELDPEHFKSEAKALANQFGKHFKIDIDDIQGAMQWAVARMRSFTQTYGIRSLSSNTLQFVSVRADGKEVPLELKSAPPIILAHRRRKKSDSRQERQPEIPTRTYNRATEPLTVNAPVRSISLGIDTAQPEAVKAVDPLEILKIDALLAGIESIVDLLGHKPFDLRKVHECAVEAVMTGLALTDVLLFDRAGENEPYQPTSGLGPLYECLRGRLGLIGPDNKDVFGISLSRKEDVLISNGRDGKIVQYIPPWVRLNTTVQSMIILPVHDGETVVGLLCGLRSAAPPLVIGSQILQTLRALRIHLATARRLAGKLR